MIPTPDERDALFKAFARAIFKRDLDGLYRVVSPDFLWSYHDGEQITKVLADPAAVAAHLEAEAQRFEAQRFHDVAYHHLEAMSFMTFRVTEKLRDGGEIREQRGIERYEFRDGRIALKDVYRKPVEPRNG